jgi:hypothetical protein
MSRSERKTGQGVFCVCGVVIAVFWQKSRNQLHIALNREFEERRYRLTVKMVGSGVFIRSMLNRVTKVSKPCGSMTSHCLS